MTDPAPGTRAGDVPDAVERHGAGEVPRPGEEDLFAALDRTRADLAAAPRPVAPEGLAASLTAALAAERAAGAPAAPPAPSRPGDDDGAARPDPSSGSRRRVPARRRPARPWMLATTGAVAAAAVAVLVLGVGGTGPATPPPAPTAAPGPGAPVVLTSGDLPQALRSGLGGRDGTTDPAERAGCLVAHGLPAATVPLGTRAVVLDGRPGTLYVLPTGRAARFRLLVVGPGCAPGSPETVQDVTVGG